MSATNDEKKIIETKLIFILGMHRSGTSALTGALSLLGVHPGLTLMPAAPKVNPKGFWEDINIVNLNTEILSALNSSWHDERNLPNNWWLVEQLEKHRTQIEKIIKDNLSGHSKVAIKDPRLCRLLPLWLSILKENQHYSPCFVIILRDPVQVAQSLYHRDGINLDRACILWFQHIYGAYQWTKKFPRVVVCYEDLINNWYSTLSKINKILDLDLDLDNATVKNEVGEFVDRNLRSDWNSEYINNVIGDDIKKLYDALLVNFESADVNNLMVSTKEKVDVLLSDNSLWSEEIQLLSNKKTMLESELNIRKSILDQCEIEINRVKKSIYWKMTFPIRFFFNQLKKIL